MKAMTQNISRMVSSKVLVFTVLILLAAVLGLSAQAWALNSGVYAFVCQKQPGADYVMVVKNGQEAPSSEEYGAVINAYKKDLRTISAARWDKSEWPWIAVLGSSDSQTTLDPYAAAVKKVVVDGPDGSVALPYTAGIFRKFTNCTYFDLTGLSEEGYEKSSWNNTVSDFDGMLQGVKVSGNDDITIVLGSQNMVEDIGSGTNYGSFYRKINNTYDLVSTIQIPTLTACTLYTVKPADCPISPLLSEYEVIFTSSSVKFNGDIRQGLDDVSVVLSANHDFAIDPTKYKILFQKQNGTLWERATERANGIGHYRVYAQALERTGYSGTTDYVVFDITAPDDNLTLYRDSELTVPTDSQGLTVAGAFDVYVKYTTDIKSVNANVGVAELMVDATSTNPSVLYVDSIQKVGEYTDDHYVYKVTLHTIKRGNASISLWGYAPFGPALKPIVTPVVNLKVSVDVNPASLQFASGSAKKLQGMIIAGDSVEVDLEYQGRDPQSITSNEIIINNPQDFYYNLMQPIYFDLATAVYDITSGKLLVTPTASEHFEAQTRTDTLSITIPGGDGYGEVTVEINVTVSRLTPTAKLTLLPNGDSIPELLTLKPGEERQVLIEYSGEGLIDHKTPTPQSTGSLVSSTNYGIAEIINYTAAKDGKSGVFTIRANEASASYATLRINVVGSSKYMVLSFDISVRVVKASLPITLNPASLDLKVGKTGAFSVSGDDGREITWISTDSNVARVTYSKDTKKFTVDALNPGTAIIQVTAQATPYINESVSALRVTVTEADVILSVNPNKLDLFVNQAGTLELFYEGSEQITLTNSDEEVATVVFDEQPDAKPIVLTVNALKLGTTTITFSVPETETTDAAQATVLVNVKDAAPPLGKDTDYTLYLGEDSWSLEYTEALHYQVDPANIIRVVASDDKKTLTVTPRSLGTATLTIWSDETETTQALAPVNINFTVSKPVKPIKEIPALSLQVGAKALSTINLLDANNQAISGVVTISGVDPNIAKVSYDPATKVLSILAVAEGEMLIKLSSDLATDDYTMQITVRDATTIKPTLDAGDTGVKVSGSVKSEGSESKATIREVKSGSAFDNLTAESKAKSNTLLKVYEVILTIDGQEVHDGFGTLTLDFPVSASLYPEGSEIIVSHLHNDGRLTSEIVKVKDAKATIKVTDLSNFAITVAKLPDSSSSNNLDPNSSNPSSVDPNSGNNGSLVTSSGSQNSGTNSGTGSLATSSRSTGTGTGTGKLATSKSSGLGVDDPEALGNDTDLASIDDADTALNRINGFGSAEDDPQAGIEPWMLAVGIGLIVLVLAAILWFFLRLRRRRAEESFAEVQA